MVCKLTASEKEALAKLLEGEYTACKRAGMYASLAADARFAALADAVAHNHRRRFCSIFGALNGNYEEQGGNEQ